MLPLRSVIQWCVLGSLPFAASAYGQGQPGPISFRADWAFKAIHAPVFLALERGYYSKEGLEVQFVAGSGSANTVKSVGSKSDTFGLADAAVVARAAGEGAPVKAIAGVQQGNPIAIVARAEIKSPKDLAGKVLVTTAASGPAQLFPVFAKGVGFDPGSVTIANVAGNAQLSTFMSGRGDAVTVFTNNELQLLEARSPGHAYNVFRYADYGVTMLNLAIFTHNDTLAQNPQMVRKFVRATLKGFEDTIKSPAAAVEAFMKANPTADRPLLERQLEASLKLVHTEASKGKPVGWMAEADWTATLDRLEKDLGMKNRMPASAYYTNEYQ